ncbi:MAG: hypothetical protein NTW19_01280 [Planctomycetota bacterium]|nr:hypothetical protein [Planctomycetota bacterium]
MNDVVLDLLRPEGCVFALALVGYNWICRFQIEACVKETAEDERPRLVFIVVECEGKDTTGPEDATGLGPAIGHHAKVKRVGVGLFAGIVTILDHSGVAEWIADGL